MVELQLHEMRQKSLKLRATNKAEEYLEGIIDMYRRQNFHLPIERQQEIRERLIRRLTKTLDAVDEEIGRYAVSLEKTVNRGAFPTISVFP